jgi:hypothetical protein
MTAIKQAKDEIQTAFRTAWLAADTSDEYPIRYWDVAYVDTPDTPWCRLTVRHQDAEKVTLSNDVGARRFRRYGVATVQIFTFYGKGGSLSDDLATIAKNAFEGVTTSPGRVIFHNVRSQEIGQEGQWFQTNVLADFEYDEIR